MENQIGKMTIDADSFASQLINNSYKISNNYYNYSGYSSVSTISGITAINNNFGQDVQMVVMPMLDDMRKNIINEIYFAITNNKLEIYPEVVVNRIGD